MEKLEKYCPQCKKKCEVYSLGCLPIALVDNSIILEYKCKECGRVFRERIYKKIIE